MTDGQIGHDISRTAAAEGRPTPDVAPKIARLASESASRFALLAFNDNKFKKPDVDVGELVGDILAPEFGLTIAPSLFMGSLIFALRLPPFQDRLDIAQAALVATHRVW